MAASTVLVSAPSASMVPSGTAEHTMCVAGTISCTGVGEACAVTSGSQT